MSTPVTTAADPPRAEAWGDAVRDLVSLAKPSITAMAVLTAAGGLWLARAQLDLLTTVSALVGTSLAVASANALNMFIERESDRNMARTRNRPLPAGRMRPGTALAFGVATGALGIATLALGANLLTAGLGLFALVSYVLVYTPLKRVTPLALVIGAVPGAMPPLMGWCAATGEISASGLVLFGILFLWQLPHFIAITLFRKRDYANAGLRVISVVRGDRTARQHAAAYALALLPVSLLLVPLGVAGTFYFSVALFASGGFAWLTLLGLRRTVGVRWARQVFVASLLYLPLLTAGLVIDALL